MDLSSNDAVSVDPIFSARLPKHLTLTFTDDTSRTLTKRLRTQGFMVSTIFVARACHPMSVRLQPAMTLMYSDSPRSLRHSEVGLPERSHPLRP